MDRRKERIHEIVGEIGRGGGKGVVGGWIEMFIRGNVD